MEEKIVKQQYCSEPDPDGDVVLRYLKHEPEESVSFRVSSKVLQLASPVFARMLSPSFKEGHELLHNDCVIIELSDDDPLLMEIILNVLHYQSDSSEYEVDDERLARLAIHCDKYDCIKALGTLAAIWFMKLEEKGPYNAQYGFQLLAAYLWNDPKSFLKISKAALVQLTPGYPAQWSQENILALLPDSLTKGVTKKIESTLDKMEVELQHAESLLREFHQCYEVAQLICVSCGRTLPGEAKKCHPCRNTVLLRKYCAEDTRIAEYFAVLRKVKLWPMKTRLGEVSIVDTASRFASIKADFKHQCAAGKGCPLMIVLESLMSEISQIKSSINGFCLLCVRHDEGWRYDTKCYHES